jgi:hypothetical protein
MNDSMVFVNETASDLKQRGTKLPVPLLAPLLNGAGCLTRYGSEYLGGRGMYRLVHATYYALITERRYEEAEAVAESFVKPDGKHAWDGD